MGKGKTVYSLFLISQRETSSSVCDMNRIYRYEVFENLYDAQNVAWDWYEEYHNKLPAARKLAIGKRNKQSIADSLEYGFGVEIDILYFKLLLLKREIK